MTADLQLGLRAWRTVLRSHARVLHALDTELQAAVELSVRDYEVLVRLARSRKGPLRMSELAAAAYLSPSGVTRLVDHLVARGLVTRYRDPTDARGYLAELTKEGRATFRRASRAYEAAIAQHFARCFSPEEMAEIIEVLGRLLSEREQA